MTKFITEIVKDIKRLQPFIYIFFDNSSIDFYPYFERTHQIIIRVIYQNDICGFMLYNNKHRMIHSFFLEDVINFEVGEYGSYIFEPEEYEKLMNYFKIKFLEILLEG